MTINNQHHRTILQSIAHRAMLERGLLPDFSSEALTELQSITEHLMKDDRSDDGSLVIRDMRQVLWASIDNDDSLDLDQLTFAEVLPAGKVKIFIAIADVDSSVKNGSAIDQHARINTTSVYTPAQIFPMLPEKISTDITSLNLNEDRLSVVVEILINQVGEIGDSNIYRAWVRNHAKLAYNSMAEWLVKSGPIPEALANIPGLAENLRLQDKTAQRMKKLRHLHGALDLDTIEAKPVFDGDQIRELEIEEKNRAKEIVEDFMIAVNGVTARFLSTKNFPSIRRVVRTPKRWERIVVIAKDHNFKLPESPDSKALEEFLISQKAKDPLRFPDLSLAVIKLLGPGEYIAESPDGNLQGHFGLAVKDYGHSTAPNRRYPDLLTQRLIKAALEDKPTPYSKNELDVLAAHCTKAEDAANKVERQVGKSAAALLLESRIGEKFDSIVTGASQKGTWVRLLTVPVEGMLVSGFENVDVGDRISVQLSSVDVEKGFIDFQKIGTSQVN
ncbi:MAG: RNB domain-containing ribonuclease [Anaerolineaceae bacterium]|nr:RNB domain-containing ribonuclease [Anaerolineaceae bacterium]